MDLVLKINTMVNQSSKNSYSKVCLDSTLIKKRSKTPHINASFNNVSPTNVQLSIQVHPTYTPISTKNQKRNKELNLAFK